MRRVFGPRTAVEAAFLVAVPIVVGVVLGAGVWTIVAASAVAYLLIVLVEAFLWYEGKRVPAAPRVFRRPRSVVVRRGGEPPVAPDPAEESVVVRPREEPPAAAPVAAPQPDPEPEPEPQPEPEPEPQPAPPAEPAGDQVRVLRPAPVPVERPPLVAVPDLGPDPGPEPDPEPQPQPEPAPAAVVPIGPGAAPRRWSLWDLERLSREQSGGDPVRDEERTFLLMYLREFADADGMLPIDFDGLVRDSFGDLVGAR